MDSKSNKVCIVCGTSEVRRPKKDWLKGPTCHTCYKKTRYKANPEPDKARRNNHYLTNIVKERQQRREYHLLHKEENKKRGQAYYSENKETCLARNKRYREAHRAEANEYVLQRRKTDINFRLSGNLRNRLRRALECNYKKGSAVSDLGISIEEFRLYMESKFEIGMSWDNYGEYSPIVPRWNINHIKPLSKFDLTDKKQLKEACHHTNLQPMWALPNLIKGNKYDAKE